MNSFEFIRKFNWIYQPFKMFTNFLKISLIFIIWIFEKIINEFTNEFIELNLSLSFLNFSHFAKLFIKFFKSKSLPWISNRYCHSRNEFTDEFIEFYLIIFCHAIDLNPKMAKKRPFLTHVDHIVGLFKLPQIMVRHLYIC